MSEKVTLGSRLKETRKERGLTQQQVADLLHVSRGAYSYYETDNRNIPCEMLVKLCEVLAVSADYLLGKESTKNPIYANISDVTGFSEECISILTNMDSKEKAILEYLIREEPVEWPDMFAKPSDDYCPPPMSDEELEKAYNEYIEYEKKSIFNEIEEQWMCNDAIATALPIEEPQPDPALYEEERALYDLYDDIENIPTVEELKEEQKRMEEYWDFLEKEKKKSNLLSAIIAYISFQSECNIYSETKTEPLTNTHTIKIGCDEKHAIEFPSDASNRWFERMLEADIVEALKLFKENYKHAKSRKINN